MIFAPNQIDLNETLRGNFYFHSKLAVSKKSNFEDGIWDFTDDTKERQNSVPSARLVIPWSKYSIESAPDVSGHYAAFLPPEIITDLKVFAYFYLHLPSVFTTRGTRNIKPQTVSVTIRALVRFFSTIYKHYLLQVTKSSTCHLRTLSNITLLDIRTTLKKHEYSDGTILKKGLQLLATPFLYQYFVDGVLSWNKHDLDTLEFQYEGTRDGYNKVMPNELFRFLSHKSSNDVSGFLNFLGLVRADKSIDLSQEVYFGGGIDRAAMFEDYIAIRLTDRDRYKRNNRKDNSLSQPLRKRFNTKYGLTVGDFFKYLYRVQRSAYTVIGLYTGARYSDMTSFKIGCIRNVHGCHVLVGTETKHNDFNEKEGNDLWPAIPIMRDALNCLEQISRFTFNPYLISSSETIHDDTLPRPLSLTGLTGAINSYLAAIDESKRWANWHINPHQLRHTLAFQLARADVGLVFISHQLKHLYTALNTLPSNVTLNYGNIGELTQQRAMHMQPAYLEAANELYNPNSPVAGGGAEEFKARRKAYFEGMAANGWTTTDLIENLAYQGLPFASVGIGYCGGKRERLLKDGTKEIPPCLGSLQCSPATCKQAIITKCHEPMWQKILDQNIELSNDPRMAYAKDSFLTMADTARTVLSELNEDAGKG